jgi:hypothetical protein
MKMNAAAAAAAASVAGMNSVNMKGELPSPYGGEFALNDLPGNHHEWLGLDTVLAVSPPGSRGSSIVTSNIPQTRFVSIDPTRLKEVPSAPGSEASKSPTWSLPDLQPSSYEAPSNMPTSTIARRLSGASNDAAAAAAGTKRKRQGSLPDIFVPVDPQPQPRGLQRSMSHGNPVVVTQFDTSLQTSFCGSSSALVPSFPARPSGILTSQPVSGHQRTLSYNALATIPETPSTSSTDTQWVFQGATQNLSYAVPVTPSLPGSGQPSPMVASGETLPNLSQDMILRRPSSCPITEPPVNSVAYTMHLQQQEANRQYLQPTQPFPLISTDQLSVQTSFAAYPGQFDTQLLQMSGSMSAGPMPTVPLSAGPMQAGPLSATVVGIGRPLMPAQSSHIRRSSDSELAFGQPNVGTMLRSTSVPQGLAEPHMYSSVPPVPAVNGYAPMTFVPYEPQGLGYGRPEGSSPPRKRVASKRVGTCLKPGPKGKPKPKTEGEMTIDLHPTLSEATLHSMHHHDEIPTDLHPVSFEEFRASFTLTPMGTLIPVLGIEAMTERLMYATPDIVVDACFRSCYGVDKEFSNAAEKDTKVFKCLFDECVGPNARTFMRKSAVDSHVRTHIGFRPFRCEVDPECDARFVRKHDRDRHVATHRTEKSFLCTDCGQNFARSDALLRHRAKRDACKARTGLV